MVEIIAVLVIIGILAAVAAPKFISMAGEARKKAAVAGISECKASLAVAYSKAYLTAGGTQPAVGDVMTAAGFTSAAAVDFGEVNVTPTTDASNDQVDIVANSVDGTSVSGVSDSWDLPSN